MNGRHSRGATVWEAFARKNAGREELMNGRWFEVNMGCKEGVVSCYEHEVPAFVEPALDMIYGSIFTSLVQHRLTGGLPRDVSTYVVRREGRITTVFLFHVTNRRVQVLNEVIRISQEEIDRFAAFIFDKYPAVSLIAFKAIETDIQRLPFPYQRVNQLEDIFMSLPDTPEAYLASLGKNTRRNVKRYTDRLKKTFPSFRFDIYERDVPEEIIREIVGFNRQRMAGKNKASRLDEAETQRILKLSRARGLVGVISIDGKVCAGGISFRAGANYFLDVLAHDPKYNDYWVGMLCCYLTICECIQRQGKEFHFLWGRYDYKFTLGAVQHDLDALTVYRSHAGMLCNMSIALKNAAQGRIRLAKRWLDESGGQTENALVRIARRLVNQYRHSRHAGNGFQGGLREEVPSP